MFSRIYTGIFITLLLAAGICLAVFQWSYSVRSKQHELNALSGIMQLVTDSLNRQDNATQPQYLNIVSSLMGGTHAVRSLETIERAHREKIQSGVPQRLKTHGDVIHWCIPFSEVACQELSLAPLSEQHYRASAILFVSELGRRREPASLETLQAYSPFKLTVNTFEQLNVDAQQLSRLRNRSVVVVSNVENPELFSVIAPIGDEQFLVLHDIPRFSPLPTNIVLIMLSIAALTVGVGCFLLIKLLERKLSQMDAKLTEFGEGQLHARVNIGGGTYKDADSIDRLGVRFNEMADKVQSLVETERALLQAASHELRTPLARMRFRLETFDDNEVENTDQTQVAGLRHDVDAIQGLVDELLNFNRIAADSESGQNLNINPNSVILSVVDELADLYPSVKINIKLIESDVIELDIVKFKRLASNLIENALKYTTEVVNVTSEYANNTFKMIVEDDGPGIASEEREKIFTPFYRISSQSIKKRSGYGIGLATVKRIIEINDGKIEVEDSMLGGAKFIVTLEAQNDNH